MLQGPDGRPGGRRSFYGYFNVLTQNGVITGMIDIPSRLVKRCKSSLSRTG